MIRSHWFALSSRVMSSGRAIAASLPLSRPLAAGSSVMRLLLWRLRERVDLLQERQHVRGDPALDDPAARDPHEVAVRPDDVLARGRDAEQLAGVRPAHDRVSRDLVP